VPGYAWLPRDLEGLLDSMSGDQCKVVLKMLYLARYRDGYSWIVPMTGETVVVPKFSFISSIRMLRDACGLKSDAPVRTAIRKLELGLQLTHQSTRHYTLFTFGILKACENSSTSTNTRFGLPSTRAQHTKKKGEEGSKKVVRKKNTRQASAEALSAAASLGRAIVTWKRDHKLAGMAPAQKKSWVEKQAVHLDRMVALDKRTWGRIAEVLRWLPTNEFWAPNILSGAKLREKFDKLEAKMRPSARVDAEKQLLIDSIDKGYS